MQYLLLLYGCERPGPEDPRYEGALARVNAFTQACVERGALVAAAALKPEDTATTVRVRDGQTLITDGPFAETREQLGGYFLLECRDLDTALELAAECPMAVSGSVEVRPLDSVPGWTWPPEVAADHRP